MMFPTNEEQTSTYVTVPCPWPYDGDWPLRQSGWLVHRRDLSDLDEPYLSAVKEALAHRK